MLNIIIHAADLTDRNIANHNDIISDGIQLRTRGMSADTDTGIRDTATNDLRNTTYPPCLTIRCRRQVYSDVVQLCDRVLSTSSMEQRKLTSLYVNRSTVRCCRTIQQKLRKQMIFMFLLTILLLRKAEYQ